LTQPDGLTGKETGWALVAQLVDTPANTPAVTGPFPTYWDAEEYVRAQGVATDPDVRWYRVLPMMAPPGGNWSEVSLCDY